MKRNIFDRRRAALPASCPCFCADPTLRRQEIRQTDPEHLPRPK